MGLLNEISQLTHLSEEAANFLNANIQKQNFKKGEEILGFEQNCNYLYFINKGIIRGYYFLDAKEITNWFGQENEFATCFYSFISKKLSVETIQALEDCELILIPYSTLNTLYEKFPETERVGRLVIENYYLRLEERLLSIQFKSAKERYQNLMDSKPSLLKRAALGQIASYLGISQETLSRMRAEF
jgi:CRP-like cAMP-binding protein